MPKSPTMVLTTLRVSNFQNSCNKNNMQHTAVACYDICTRSLFVETHRTQKRPRVWAQRFDYTANEPMVFATPMSDGSQSAKCKILTQYTKTVSCINEAPAGRSFKKSSAYFIRGTVGTDLLNPAA